MALYMVALESMRHYWSISKTFNSDLDLESKEFGELVANIVFEIDKDGMEDYDYENYAENLSVRIYELNRDCFYANDFFEPAIVEISRKSRKEWEEKMRKKELEMERREYERLKLRFQGN